MPRATGSTHDAAAPANIGELRARPEICSAFGWIDGALESLTDEHIALNEVEAPPFGESARAELFGRMLEGGSGLPSVETDAAGNVIGTRRGVEDGPAVVLSAHLDTVFPPGTDCVVRRNGGKLYAPGIADDGCGLVAMLAVARALDAARIRTLRPVQFLATVGEEGDGDLRGCRHFFSGADAASRVGAFVSIDGPGTERITHRALGSRRYEVTLTGPGGHSWGDFGIVNPIHALSRAVSRMSAYPAPIEPRTSYSVGVVSGGTSVNAIPSSATCRIDLRSVSAAELNRVEQFFRDAVSEAVAEENRIAAASGTVVETLVRPIGDRPSGETPETSAIVQAAIDATDAVGVRHVLDCASTDSNIPISLGIPALTIGGGGSGGGTHTLEEWYDPAGRDLGIKRALLLVIALAGLAD